MSLNGWKDARYAMSINQTYGIILAGGRSSRMGTNKAYLPLENKNLLEHAYQLLIHCGITSILVSGDHEGYTCVSDIHKYRGPVTGILSVWEHIKTTSVKTVLVIPVDMPWLVPDLIQELLAKGEHNQTVFFEKKPLPCCISRFALESMHKNHLGMDISLLRFLRQFDALELSIPTDSNHYFYNVNTPDEWQYLITHSKLNQQG